MAKPASRAALKEWCLRRLGKPVIEINVDDDQLEDRIDEGLQIYQEYHYDGAEKVYEKHKLTAADIENQYISVPSPGWSNTEVLHTTDSYIGITKVFDVRGTSIGMWDIRYQMRLSDLTTFGTYLGGYDLLSYQMRMNNLSLISELLTGKVPIRFSKHNNRIYLDWQWGTDAVAGEYIIFEAFKIIDPEAFTDVYNDMFLKQYITALFKEQWGMNLSKFEGVQMVGGVTLNGRAILDEARTDIEKLREELSLKYELPVDMMMA
jgi:hypothetical protein